MSGEISTLTGRGLVEGEVLELVISMDWVKWMLVVVMQLGAVLV